MRKIVYSLLLLVFIGIGYIVVTYFLPTQSPLAAEEKRKAIEHILDRQVVTEEKGPQKWKTYSGKYTTFFYPEDCAIHKKKLSASILESFTCGLQMPRRNISVQVAEAATFEESSAVVVRRSQPEEYREEAKKIGKYKGIIFIKNTLDGAEKTGFFVVNGKLYSIAVIGAQIHTIEKLYGEVEESIRIKEL